MYLLKILYSLMSSILSLSSPYKYSSRDRENGFRMKILYYQGFEGMNWTLDGEGEERVEEICMYYPKR